MNPRIDQEFGKAKAKDGKNEENLQDKSETQSGANTPQSWSNARRGSIRGLGLQNSLFPGFGKHLGKGTQLEKIAEERPEAELPSAIKVEQIPSAEHTPASSRA